LATEAAAKIHNKHAGTLRRHRLPFRSWQICLPVWCVACGWLCDNEALSPSWFRCLSPFWL